MNKEIVLISTGAIGDLVIASALQKPLSELGHKTGIVSVEFTLPLWNNLENTATYAFGQNKSPPDLSPEAQIVDISDYLAGFPQSQPLPKEFTGEENKQGHLCEWMAYDIFQKTRITLNASRDDVRIVLDREEVTFGRDYLYDLSQENGRKPTLIISPYATTKNRNIPLDTLVEIVRGTSGLVVACQLTPYADNQRIAGTLPVGDKDLRKAAAILLAADTYLGVDSGPLHMIMGAMQGTPTENLVDDINTNPAKVIVALGSSMMETVSYQGNQNIFARNVCEIAPCGAHGYYPLEGYAKLFGREFHASANPTKDKSGCTHPDFATRETAGCMETIKAEEIITRIEAYFR